MAKVVIDSDGTKTYYNDDGQIHREDGPALIYPNGCTEHWINGEYASNYELGAPDVVDEGGVTWWHDRQHHSINRPANDYPNGQKLWLDNGYEIWPTLK